MAEPDTHFTKLLHRYIEQKDERAVEEIVQHYGPLLRGIVKHRLENWRYFTREDVRDVEQDAWKSIFRLVLDGVDLDDLDNDAKLTALIKLIAERKAAKLVRAQVHTAKRDVRRLISLDGAASRLTRILVDPQLGPAKRAELNDLLRHELEALPSEHQRILQMRTIGWSHERIAEELGCSVDSACEQVARAFHAFLSRIRPWLAGS